MQFPDARGLAAMCVVVQHSLEQLSPFWARFFLEGSASGSSACGVLPVQRVHHPCLAERQASQAKFWIGRFFRLFPAYWLSVPLGIFAVWTLFGRTIGAGEVALNLTMIPARFGARPVMGSYWTLEYELGFYVLCLALFKAGLLDRRYAAAVITMVVGTRHLPTEALNFFSGRTAVALTVALVIAIPFVWYRTRDAGAQRRLASLTVAPIVPCSTGRRPSRPRCSSSTLFFGTSLFRWSAGTCPAGAWPSSPGSAWSRSW
jgi:peptidoglycan/LPS O-acetylase OafA/YrhL